MAHSAFANLMSLTVRVSMLEMMLLQPTESSSCQEITDAYDSDAVHTTQDEWEECLFNNWHRCTWITGTPSVPARCVDMKGDYSYIAGGFAFKPSMVWCNPNSIPFDDAAAPLTEVPVGSPAECVELCASDPDCAFCECETARFWQGDWFEGWCYTFSRAKLEAVSVDDVSVDPLPDDGSIGREKCTAENLLKLNAYMWENEPDRLLSQGFPIYIKVPLSPERGVGCAPKKHSTWTQAHCISNCNKVSKGCNELCSTKCNDKCQCTQALWCRDDPHWHYKGMTCGKLATLYPESQKLKRKCKRFKGRSHGKKQVAKVACPATCMLCVNTLV